jgi:hypothetical protein
MDGPSAGAPGVAGKVGELLDTIREGAFCAEQASLMRGFAYGILDPDGERHALAVAHWRECSACRRYVLSLRGLAAVLPPPPLPLALGAGMAAGAGASAAGAGAGASAAGAGGAAGGGWVLAGGGLGAKLAVGCLVAVSVGAGCVALTGVPIVPHYVPTVHHRHAARQNGHGLVGADVGFSSLAGGVQTLSSAAAIVHAGAARAGTSSVLTPADKASREFGLGQLASGVVPLDAKPEVTHAVYASRATHTARAASSSPSSGFEVVPASAHPAATSSDAGSSSGGSTSSSSAAQREFGLG